MKLMPHVYQVAGVSLSHAYDAAAYLIEGTEGLYLLDCGTPDGFEAIIGNIQKLQFAPEDIRAVYGTHGHYDHVGLRCFLSKNTAAVFACTRRMSGRWRRQIQ